MTTLRQQGLLSPTPGCQSVRPVKIKDWAFEYTGVLDAILCVLWLLSVLLVQQCVCMQQPGFPGHCIRKMLC